MVNKEISIVETFYLSYSFLLFSDNATTYFVYIKNILQAKNMNKNTGI